MYCIKCGKQIEDNSKFCPECGASINTGEQENIETKLSDKVNSINYVEVYKDILHKFFSKNPFSVFEKCKEKKSLEYSLFLIIYVLLFALVIGKNIVQLLNYIITEVLDIVSSNIGYSIPSDELMVSSSNYGSLVLLVIIIVLLELAGCILITNLYKKNLDGIIVSINTISLSYLPMIVGLIINFILGFVYVPLTLAITISCYILHLLFMFYGIKSISDNENTIWLFGIFIILMSIIGVLVACHGFEKEVNTMMENLMQFVKEQTNSKINGLFGLFE